MDQPVTSPYSLSRWRLIITPPASGAWNMAADEALLETMALPGALPILRLYAWQPPCLSVGYAQSYKDIDFARLSALGWQLVRRPTGGKAILHTDELTYSVIAPYGELRLEGGVLESYRRLAAALLAALHLLALPAESNALSPSISDAKGPVCFEVPSNYEITVSGKKLVGSAQARRKEGILQHGSLPLFGDLTRITQVLAFDNEVTRAQAAARLLERAGTATSLAGKPVTWEQAAGAFRRAFSSALSLEFIDSSLSEKESQRAAEIVSEKYAQPAWTERV